MNLVVLKCLSHIRTNAIFEKASSEKKNILNDFKTCVVDALIGIGVLRTLVGELAKGQFLCEITRGVTNQREHYRRLCEHFNDFHCDAESHKLPINESYFDAATEGTRKPPS